MVCDKVSCATKLCLTMLCECAQVVWERECETMLCVCDEVVCDRWCVTKLCVKERVLNSCALQSCM
jgi:hypothetical protein